MKQNIKNCREAGYQGLIQVVQIKTDKETWLLNSKNTIKDELNSYGYSKYQLKEVHNYIDSKNNLDITELEFSKEIGNKTVEFISEKNSVRNSLPYYRVVREFIGNNPLFSCGISIIIENKTGEYVIGRRSDNGKWAFPAGSKELGESIISTVHNEVMEEFGIEVEELQLLGLLSGDELRVTYPNGHQMFYLGFVFYGKYKSGKLKVNDSENTEVKWITMDELKKLDIKTINRRLTMFEEYNDSVIY